MRKSILYLVAALAIATTTPAIACEYGVNGLYLELGIGRHGLAQSWWEGRDELGGHGAIGWVWHFGKGLSLDAGVQHESQPWLDGDDPEHVLDSFLIKGRKEFH